MHLLNKEIPKEAIQALHVLKELMEGSVIGIYLFGSAVHGGLRLNSDVDVLGIVNDRLFESTRKELTHRLMVISGKIGNTDSIRPLEVTIIKLEDIVPWRYPPKYDFLYGEWLRDDFEKGYVPEPSCDPDLAVVLAQARIHSIQLFGPEASTVLDPVPLIDMKRGIKESLPELVEGIKGDERNVMLTLARMWQTVTIGEIHPKNKAATWAVDRLPKGYAELLELAEKAYRGKYVDRWEEYTVEVAALVSYMRNAIESHADN